MKKKKGLLYPPKEVLSKKTIVARVTEEEWDSIQEMRRNNNVIKELEGTPSYQEDSTLECSKEDLDPWPRDLEPAEQEYYCKCRRKMVRQFCESCCPTL